MELFQLKYFVTVIEEGSISAAARKLHLSQPPLSLQIKKLEEEFGISLFIRKGRNLIITDAGKALYRKAKALLDMSETANKELKAMVNGCSGVLRIGTISSVDHAKIRDKIFTFHKLRPDVLFEIVEKNTYSLIDMLINNELDLAFVRTPFPQEHFNCLSLHKEAMVAVAHESFFDANTPLIDLKWLSSKPLIVYRRWEALIKNAFNEKGFSFCPLCVCDDARTSISWASSGIGISLTPKSALESCQTDKLLAYEVEDLGIFSSITLIRKKTADNVLSGLFFDSFKDFGEFSNDYDC